VAAPASVENPPVVRGVLGPFGIRRKTSSTGRKLKWNRQQTDRRAELNKSSSRKNVFQAVDLGWPGGKTKWGKIAKSIANKVLFLGGGPPRAGKVP